MTTAAVDLKKTLPHDETAEKAVLGAMLIDNRCINEVFLEIDRDDFFIDAHRLIAAAVSKLVDAGSSVDIVTVSSFLERNSELKFAGGSGYVSSLVDGIPETLSVVDYVRIIKDRSALRKIILTSLGIIQKGVEPAANTESLIDEIQEDIIKISENRVKQGFVPTGALVADTMQHIETIQKHGESSGLKTDFDDLDAMVSGFQPTDLVVIAARPSMGKTALALNIAVNMAVKHDHAVAFFSIEMSRQQIMMRLLATRAQVSMASIRTGKPHLTQKEWHALEMAASELGNSKVYIDDSPTLSILEMRTRARKLKSSGQLDIIFVDYLQLMKVTGDMLRRSDSRAQEVGIITASLKALAKELNVPVVAMAQLNRSPETRGVRKEKGPKYLLSDLKESGAIEQDADLVIFLHRDDQMDKDTERKGIADLFIAKQRNGPTGKISLAYIDKYTKFANMEFSTREY